MKFNEIARTIWSNNRWYRRLSVLTVSLIIAYISLFVFLSITEWVALAGIAGAIFMISNLSIVLWLACTVMVIYIFFNNEDQFGTIKGSQKPKWVKVLGILYVLAFLPYCFNAVIAIVLSGFHSPGLLTLLFVLITIAIPVISIYSIWISLKKDNDNNFSLKERSIIIAPLVLFVALLLPAVLEPIIEKPLLTIKELNYKKKVTPFNPKAKEVIEKLGQSSPRVVDYKCKMRQNTGVTISPFENCAVTHILLENKGEISNSDILLSKIDLLNEFSDEAYLFMGEVPVTVYLYYGDATSTNKFSGAIECIPDIALRRSGKELKELMLIRSRINLGYIQLEGVLNKMQCRWDGNVRWSPFYK